MYLTHHGAGRVLERTRMDAEDIMKMIEANITVSLGTWDNYEYLLFYSEPDNGCKIAVVSDDRQYLITIWETSYVLPLEISAPTRKQQALVKNLQQKRMQTF